MDALRPVMWHHGQFLQPQHLQLLDKRLEALLYPGQQYAQPWFWGNAGITFREDELARDVIAIKDARLLFPDGVFVSVPENAHVPARSFQRVWAEREKPLHVYIGVKTWRDEDNVTQGNAPEEEEERNDGRFIAPLDPEEKSDYFGDGPSALVFRMKYRLRIFWESELGSAGDYTLLPIARVIQNSMGETRFAPDYIPPLIAVDGSPTLVELIRSTVHNLMERSRQLEEFKAPSSLEMKHWDVKSVLFMLALRSINRILPSLRHALGAPHIHPWHVYNIFIQLLGDLSTFSDRVTAMEPEKGGPAGIPPYSHTDLYACFKTVRELLIHLLSGLVFEPDSLVPFTQQGAYHVAQLQPHHFDSGNGHWLILSTSEELDLMEMTRTGSLKMGELNALSIMLSKALPGIPLNLRTEPPPGVPRRQGAHYLSLDSQSGQWNDVPLTSKLAVYLANPPADLRMELVVFRTHDKG